MQKTELAVFFTHMETAYYEIKNKIVALASAYYDAEESTRENLRKKADFFPISRSGDKGDSVRSLIIRVRGELFLVEDTRGGELDVFAMLLPLT